jgi:hypothetical protein
MRAFTKENYLPFRVEGDVIWDMLYNNMAHFNLQSVYDELKQSGIMSVSALLDHVMSQYDYLPVYKKSDILKNALKVNSLQVKKLQKRNFNINFKGTLEKKLETKKVALNLNNRDLKKRSIVLYFRGVTDVPYSVGVDIFHIIILYKVLSELIERRKLSLFNDVFVVLDNPSSERYPVFEENNVRVDYSTGSDFINKTCVFSNTVHFTGGELPDLDSFTIPLISKYILDYNNPHIPVNATNYIKVNVMYPETIFKADKTFTYNTDLESAYKGALCSWSDLFNKEDFTASYNSITNKTILSTVSEVISKILLAEKKMLSLI